MTGRNASIALILLAAGGSHAGQVDIDFNDQPLGLIEADQFADQGVTFTGDLLPGLELPFGLEDPRVSDLNGLFGTGDTDLEGIAPGWFGLASATIGFEANPGTHLTDVTFDVARRRNQDITIVATTRSGDALSHTFEANGSFLTVEEFGVDLDAIFGGEFEYAAVAMHNHGGTFGFDNILAASVIPLPHPAALAGAGLAGLAPARRQRYDRVSRRA